MREDRGPAVALRDVLQLAYAASAPEPEPGEAPPAASFAQVVADVTSRLAAIADGIESRAADAPFAAEGAAGPSPPGGLEARLQRLEAKFDAIAALVSHPVMPPPAEIEPPPGWSAAAPAEEAPEEPWRPADDPALDAALERFFDSLG